MRFSSACPDSCRNLLAFCWALCQVQDDDVQTACNEGAWFQAEKHRKAIRAFLAGPGSAERCAMLDLFGASGQMSSCWRKAGWEAFAYDIKTNSKHDLTSANGFWQLCKAGKKLMTKGLIFGGPPCSLYVWISKSVHNRREDNKYIGETGNFKVRVSNRIVANMCVFLEELSKVKARPCSLCFTSLDPMPSVLRRRPEACGYGKYTVPIK